MNLGQVVKMTIVTSNNLKKTNLTISAETPWLIHWLSCGLERIVTLHVQHPKQKEM